MAHHIAPDGRIYVDTAFINHAGSIPGVSIGHMGFGEFYADTPKGRVDFDRMRGQDFSGQSGRSHRLYGEGKSAEWLIEQMEQKGKSEKMASVRTAGIRWQKKDGKYTAEDTSHDPAGENPPSKVTWTIEKLGSDWHLELHYTKKGGGKDFHKMGSFKSLRAAQNKAQQQSDEWVANAKKNKGKSAALRAKVIRLAHANPKLRPHLLPILERTAGSDQSPSPVVEAKEGTKMEATEKTAGMGTWHRELTPLREKFMKEVVKEAAKTLKSLDVEVKKTGGNYVDGVDTNGERVTVEYTWYGYGAKFAGKVFRGGREFRVEPFEMQDRDPDGVAGHVIFHSGAY